MAADPDIIPQVSVLTKQNNDMRGELIKAREQMKHIAEKAAKDLAAERDNHARTVHVMKLDFQEAESRWGDDRLVLETKIVDQMSLLRIWREIIADLRLRLRFLQMWIWGFRRWHYNVVQNQMDAYEELPEPEPAPKREEWNIDAWDIYAIAASEFGMEDNDGDGVMDMVGGGGRRGSIPRPPPIPPIHSSSTTSYF